MPVPLSLPGDGVRAPDPWDPEPPLSAPDPVFEELPLKVLVQPICCWSAQAPGDDGVCVCASTEVDSIIVPIKTQ
jgi:hypothetical protein